VTKHDTLSQPPLDDHPFQAALALTMYPFCLVAALLAIACGFEDVNFSGWPDAGHLRTLFDLVLGTAAAVLLWLTFSYAFRDYTTPRRANPRVYGALQAGLVGLDAALAHLPTLKTENAPIAVAEVRAYRDLITRELTSTGALRWVTAAGYMTLWTALHRAEEALIVVTALDDIIEEAVNAQSRLENSTIENNDLLLAQVRQALVDLGAGQYVYRAAAELHPPTAPPPIAVGLPTATDPTMLHTQRSLLTLHLFPSSRPVVPHASRVRALPADTPVRPSDAHMLAARAALRNVRRAIDEYRDGLWSGIVEQRSRLIAASRLTALVTYALLVPFILLGVPPSRLIQASVIFLIGGVIGVFQRAWSEQEAEKAVEDYELAKTRVRTIFLFAGLAALFGVFLTELALQMFDLSTLFNVQQDPKQLLIAAVFGYAPGQVFNRLQQQTDGAKAQLKSTQGAGNAG